MMPVRRILPAIVCAIIPSSVAHAIPGPATDPLQFFEGRTDTVTTMKVVAQKPLVSRSRGVGRIKPDGSLELTQYVKEDGNPEFQRSWHIREVAPGHYVGTMSQAKGPVSIQRMGGRYVFRFAMKGHLNVEQWLTPEPSLNAARMELTIRKLGVRVAHAEGWIRRARATNQRAELIQRSGATLGPNLQPD